MHKRAILRMAAAVRGDLVKAVALYEAYLPTARNAELIERINDIAETGAGYAFNVVSEALQLEVIAALCRIWDKPGDAVHIPKIAARLKKNPKLVADQASLDAWLADVERMKTYEPLVTLRGYRSVGLSHTADPNLPDPRSLKKPHGRRVVHGDERKVLEATLAIVKALDSLLDVELHADEKDALSRTVWSKRARAFWDEVG